MSYDTILYEVHGSVGVITMNRPEKLNAWLPVMAAEQADAIARANATPEVGAIILTGAGRGFCAGADMEATFKQRLEGVDPGANTAAGQGGMPQGLDWVKTVRAAKPLIAAVNGVAVGIGMTMILPFDLIVASEKAKFGMLFIKMGLVPELASTHFLVQRMGLGAASEMCLTGRLYDAEEARACRLIDRVLPHEGLLEGAIELAAQIADNPAPQLRMIKDLLAVNGVDDDLGAVQRRETAYLRECWRSAEHAEAVRAFLEKRPPRFR